MDKTQHEQADTTIFIKAHKNQDITRQQINIYIFMSIKIMAFTGIGELSNGCYTQNQISIRVISHHQ